MGVSGEHVELNFEVYVKENSVAALSCGRDRIEDILILHLEGGKDFFVSCLSLLDVAMSL